MNASIKQKHYTRMDWQIQKKIQNNMKMRTSRQKHLIPYLKIAGTASLLFQKYRQEKHEDDFKIYVGTYKDH